MNRSQIDSYKRKPVKDSRKRKRHYKCGVCSEVFSMFLLVSHLFSQFLPNVAINSKLNENKSTVLFVVKKQSEVQLTPIQTLSWNKSQERLQFESFPFVPVEVASLEGFWHSTPPQSSRTCDNAFSLSFLQSIFHLLRLKIMNIYINWCCISNI